MGMGLDKRLKNAADLKYSKGDFDLKKGKFWMQSEGGRGVRSQQEQAEQNQQLIDSDARQAAAEAAVKEQTDAQKREIAKQLSQNRGDLFNQSVDATNALMDQLDMLSMLSPSVQIPVSPMTPGYSAMMSNALISMPIDGSVDMLQYLMQRPNRLGA